MEWCSPPEKFEFDKETVEFAGFQITIEGIKLTDKYVQAIRNFPTQPTFVMFHKPSSFQFY